MHEIKEFFDENLGFGAGILVVLIIGKLWLVSHIGTWEIVEMLFRGLVGW